MSFKTLSDIVNNKSRFDISNVAFYDLTPCGNRVVLETTLFEVYWSYISMYLAEYKLTKAEREYYKYKPHLLSLDVYGTPDLAWLILLTANRESPSTFYLKQSVKLIPLKNLKTVYDTVATKSADRINENWSEVLTKVGTDL